jgi:hypothetical protein
MCNLVQRRAGPWDPDPGRAVCRQTISANSYTNTLTSKNRIKLNCQRFVPIYVTVQTLLFSTPRTHIQSQSQQGHLRLSWSTEAIVFSTVWQNRAYYQILRFPGSSWMHAPLMQATFDPEADTYAWPIWYTINAQLELLYLGRTAPFTSRSCRNWRPISRNNLVSHHTSKMRTIWCWVKY